MTSDRKDEVPRRGPGRLAWILGILLIALVLAWALIGAWGARALEDSERDWRDDPDFRAVADLPPTAVNASALRLQGLAAAVGIETGPKIRGSSAPPLATTLPRKALSDWLAARLVARGDPLPAPPGEVAEFLEGHATEIDALIAHLVQEERLQWERHVSRRDATALPNLGGHTRTMRLLLASAAMDDAAGRRDRAGQAREAAWNLADSLSARPELISKIIQIVELRQLAAEIRQGEAPAEPWLERFGGLDPRGSMRQGFAYGARERLAVEPHGGVRHYAGSSNAVSHAIDFILPRRLIGAEDASVLHELVKDLDALDPCTGSPSGVGEAPFHSALPWDSFAMPMVWHFDEYMLQSFEEAWARALQAELEFALTRSVLQSRRALAAGAPPPEPLRLRCETWSFREERLPDGGFRLRLDGTIPWTLNAKDPNYPLEHVEP